jgi:hypothetical protein
LEYIFLSLLDSTIFRAALITRPSLRTDLRSLIQRIARTSLIAAEMDQIEHELVRSLRVNEARQLPSLLPRPSEQLFLTGKQLQIIAAVIGRFQDPRLRDKCLGVMSSAVAKGWVISK